MDSPSRRFRMRVLRAAADRPPGVTLDTVAAQFHIPTSLLKHWIVSTPIPGRPHRFHLVRSHSYNPQAARSAPPPTFGPWLVPTPGDLRPRTTAAKEPRTLRFNPGIPSDPPPKIGHPCISHTHPSMPGKSVALEVFSCADDAAATARPGQRHSHGDQRPDLQVIDSPSREPQEPAALRDLASSPAEREITRQLLGRCLEHLYVGDQLPPLLKPVHKAPSVTTLIGTCLSCTEGNDEDAAMEAAWRRHPANYRRMKTPGNLGASDTPVAEEVTPSDVISGEAHELVERVLPRSAARILSDDERRILDLEAQVHLSRAKLAVVRRTREVLQEEDLAPSNPAEDTGSTYDI